MHPHYKGKGVGSEGKSLLLAENICIYLLISKTGSFYVNTSIEKEERRGESWPEVFEYTFHGACMGNPMPELVLTPRRSRL
jgi:hypothetical protein